MNWHDYFLYDESSKTFLSWKIELRCGYKHNRVLVSPGDEAGTLTAHGYYSVRINGKGYRVNRVIYEMMVGPAGDSHIDHIDGDKKNNFLGNLRKVTAHINHRNMPKISSNTSGVTGVTFVKKQKIWRAIWRDSITGKAKSKGFTVGMYGNERAFSLACEYRSKVIENMNKYGAGYTERHGL